MAEEATTAVVAVAVERVWRLGSVEIRAWALGSSSRRASIAAVEW